MKIISVFMTTGFKLAAYKLLRRNATYLENQPLVWNTLGLVLNSLNHDEGRDLKKLFK
jgi:hypothetical protein